MDPYLYFVLVIIVCGCGTSSSILPHEGYAQVKGGRVWYRVFGEGKGTPIMMLHGGPGGTSRSFYQFEEIGKDRPVIIFDQLGGGRSDYHTDTILLTVDNFVEQVEAVRKELGLTSFYLHGHSWGTALALEYYLKYPQAVKAISFNSPYFSTKVWKADADTLIASLPDSIQQYIRTGEQTHTFDSPEYQRANIFFVKNFGLRTERRKSHLDTADVKSNKFIYRYMWGPTEFTATGSLLNYDRIESLRTIRVPVLFITGAFDEARPQTVQRFQQMIPGAKFTVIPNAGHSTMHDNKEENIKVLKAFLDQLK
ncbi:MAG: proline iminopeptidase-family hydrolase [Sediminibacterium sp.]|uniref:proline iminopeptidase-family hydrolase n=1 Tax=Sediminibacterium sp. TaxID=1917865 RepID=UPI002AB930F9|nr:proline iminopeptidase-family hydrolase [Sediminibacterium sp.]MDZ4071535.1 proline iminopeptidase-family hydrolase [Sediminibacterium sp.]